MISYSRTITGFRSGLAALTAVLLLAVMLQGCAAILDPGPPPARMQLNPALPGPVTGSPVNKQLIITMPTAGRDLDNDGVALLFKGREVRYLSGVRWTGTVPQLVQRAVIDGLQSSGLLHGVAADTDGISANARLISDIKQFCLEYRDDDSPPVALFSATFRLVDIRDGSILGTRVTQTSVPASGKERTQLIGAMETCLGQAMADVTPWILEGMRRMRQ